jgi:hypothetical protein
MPIWAAALSSSGSRVLSGPISQSSYSGSPRTNAKNIDDDQLITLREIATSWFKADENKIAQALKDGILTEVQNDNENKNQ